MAARSVFPGIVVLATIMMYPILYIAILPVVIPLLGLGGRWDIQEPRIQLLWLSGIGVWVSELHRTDMTHLIFGSPILIILSVHLLSVHKSRWMSYVAQSLLLSSVCLASFNLLILTAAHTVYTRRGSVRMFTDWRAHEFIESRIPAGEAVFAYPYSPSYYFLHKLRNPTRFSLMTYNYNTTEQYEEVIRVLEAERVEYVIWDVEFEHMQAKIFLSSLPPVREQIMEAYLESHYDTVALIDGKRIMRRKAGTDEHH